MKRLVDLGVSFVALTLLSPFLLIISLLIFLQDFHSPFYVATRVGRNAIPFRMVKFRSMVVNADRSGVSSTSATDRRITPIGHFVRRYKLDEIIQLWNVLIGDMSLVGPRPNVPAGVAVYTDAERKLLDVRPGITDFASIVFADEGDILQGQADPDDAYDKLIRPWKNRLGLFYVSVSGVFVDIKIIWYTVRAILSRSTALTAVSREIQKLGAVPELVRVARRIDPLVPTSPPGS